jgi:nitrate/TMAO reductase-like tetraheme cytochrome c subunit
MTDKLTPVRCGCGGEARVQRVRTLKSHVLVVMCTKCEIATNFYTNEAEAVTAWNRAMGAKDTNVGDKFAKDINVPNKGKWQRRKGSDCWECSECHAVLESDDIVRHNYYYCYHCGADMMNKSGYMDIEEVHYE